MLCCSSCIRLVVRCMASPSFYSSILVESKFKFKSTALFSHLAFINMLCGSCGSQGNLRTKIKANILPFFGVQTNLANSYSEIRRTLAVAHILSTRLKCVLSFFLIRLEMQSQTSLNTGNFQSSKNHS